MVSQQDTVKISNDNCMGFVRYILALAVIIGHFKVFYNWNFEFPISAFNAVGCFFALSGFLVFNSYLKSKTLISYVTKRIRRIFPPYFFIVLLCAFGLVCVSSLTFTEYYGNKIFREYLVSNLVFLNFLQPDLPGVFVDSPEPAVNASLWTIKVELMLYFSVPIVAAFIFWIKRKYKNLDPCYIFILIYIFSLVYRLSFYILYETYHKEAYNILSRQFFGQLMYFYTGVIVYYKYHLIIKYRYLLLICSIVLCYAGNFIPYFHLTIGPSVNSVLVLLVSFFPGLLRIFNKNNISYGMYLFHFPLIHLFYEFFPDNNPAAIFFLSLSCIIILSLFSWFVIEKRFLPKKYI